MCCIGDIGESLHDPTAYSINPLREMQILGMDPARENWDSWTINVREEAFQKMVMEFNPALSGYFKEAWDKG